ncbi:MAG: cold shock domain-containing protein [Hyphomonadaceae bacterium]
MNGAVKSYDSRRGMGELTRDDGGGDVAVYISEVERAGLADLAVGQRLSFSVQTDPMRKRSFAVRLELLR